MLFHSFPSFRSLTPSVLAFRLASQARLRVSAQRDMAFDLAALCKAAAKQKQAGTLANLLHEKEQRVKLFAARSAVYNCCRCNYTSTICSDRYSRRHSIAWNCQWIGS